MCARSGLGSAVPPVGLGAGCKDAQAGLCQAWVLGQLLGHAGLGGTWSIKTVGEVLKEAL